MNDINKHNAAALRRFRHRLGITQAELTLRSGVPQPTISRLENGATAWSRIDARSFAELVTHLGIPLERAMRAARGGRL